MDYVIEVLLWKPEVAYIAFEKMNTGLADQVGHSAGKCLRITAEDRGGDIQVQRSITKSQAFQQPRAKEPGAAGKKDASSARFVPQGPRLLEYALEIVFRKGLHPTSINLIDCCMRSGPLARLALGNQEVNARDQSVSGKIPPRSLAWSCSRAGIAVPGTL